MAQFLDGRKPEITYPVEWQYKLVGSDEALLRAEVKRVIGDRPHTLKPSHTSSRGRYVSLSLELIVNTEAERLGIFTALGSSPHVKFVI